MTRRAVGKGNATASITCRAYASITCRAVGKRNATASITCRAYASITCRAVTVCSISRARKYYVQ